MPKAVSLLTVQEAHKEYSSLTDQIRAKYEQLDSGEWTVPKYRSNSVYTNSYKRHHTVQYESRQSVSQRTVSS